MSKTAKRPFVPLVIVGLIVVVACLISNTRRSGNYPSSLTMDELTDLLGIQYIKTQLFLPPGIGKFELHIVKVTPTQESVLGKDSFNFTPSDDPEHFLDVLIYLMNEDHSPVNAAMDMKKGRLSYQLRVHNYTGSLHETSTHSSIGVDWLDEPSDDTGGGRRHPIDLRENKSHDLWTFESGDAQLHFRFVLPSESDTGDTEQ